MQYNKVFFLIQKEMQNTNEAKEMQEDKQELRMRWPIGLTHTLELEHRQASVERHPTKCSITPEAQTTSEALP